MSNTAVAGPRASGIPFPLSPWHLGTYDLGRADGWAVASGSLWLDGSAFIEGSDADDGRKVAARVKLKAASNMLDRLLANSGKPSSPFGARCKIPKEYRAVLQSLGVIIRPEVSGQFSTIHWKKAPKKNPRALSPEKYLEVMTCLASHAVSQVRAILEGRVAKGSACSRGEKSKPTKRETARFQKKKRMNFGKGVREKAQEEADAAQAAKAKAQADSRAARQARRRLQPLPARRWGRLLDYR